MIAFHFCLSCISCTSSDRLPFSMASCHLFTDPPLVLPAPIFPCITVFNNLYSFDLRVHTFVVLFSLSMKTVFEYLSLSSSPGLSSLRLYVGTLFLANARNMTFRMHSVFPSGSRG